MTPRSLAYIVSELQRYSLLNTNIDIKGKAYEEIVGANLRGDRGEFFTPRNVMKMVVEMIDPKMDERVLEKTLSTLIQRPVSFESGLNWFSTQQSI